MINERLCFRCKVNFTGFKSVFTCFILGILWIYEILRYCLYSAVFKIKFHD